MSVQFEKLISDLTNEIRYAKTAAEGYGAVERDKLKDEIAKLKKIKSALTAEIKNLDSAVKLKTEWCERNGVLIAK